MKKYVVVFFTIFFSQVLQAQTLNTKLYNSFDGLPSEDLSFVYENEKGIVEMCSKKGIIRFDGQRFSLQHSSNQAILNAFYHKNVLFYEDGQGLFMKDLSQNYTTTKILSKNYQDEDPNNDHFENLFVDNQERIWATDFNHIKYIQNQQTHYFNVFPENKNLNQKVYFAEVNANEILAFTSDKIYQWKAKTNDIKALNFSFLQGKKLLYAYSNSQQIIIATANEVFFVALNGLKLERTLSFSDPKQVQQIVNYENQIYIVTPQELLLIDQGHFKTIFSNSTRSLRHFVFQKSTNSYWLATSKGLLQIHLPKKGLNTVSLPSEFYTKDNFVTQAVAISKNEYVVSTSSNELFYFSKNQWKWIAKLPEISQIKSLLTHQGVVITTTNGIYKWNREKVEKLPLLGWESGNGVVKSKIIRKQLWVLFEHEPIQVYDLQTMKRQAVVFENSNAFWKDNKWNDLIEDVHGGVWLLGWMPKGFGINVLQNATMKFEEIASTEFSNDRKDFVGDYYLNGLDTGKQLVFSAFGGFNLIDYSGKINRKIDVFSHSIDDTHISALAFDLKGNLFFATDAGLHIYLKSKDKVVKLDTSDGLPTNYLQYAFTQTPTNELLLGSENAMTFVDMKKVLETSLSNAFAFTQVLVNGKEMDFSNNELNLTKEQNNITFYFSTFSYVEKNKIFYQYSVNDGEWIDLGNQSELMFNYLPPGEYNIKIKALDHLANELYKQLQFRLYIQPPFTQTLPFYLLIALATLALVYALFRYSVYRKTKEKHYELKVKDAEMKMLRAQMNPHFMFNTLNSINSYIVQNQTSDASKYLTSFSKLMRNILESSKQQWIPLEQEVKTIQLYLQLEAVRLDHIFDFEITVDEALDVSEVMIPPLIVQPFAENAIWHGLRHLTDRKGKLTVRFLLKNSNHLVIEIEDNGIGRENSSLLKKNKHISYGVQITEERIRSLHSSNRLEIEDLYQYQLACGTKISMYLNLENYD